MYIQQYGTQHDGKATFCPPFTTRAALPMFRPLPVTPLPAILLPRSLKDATRCPRDTRHDGKATFCPPFAARAALPMFRPPPVPSLPAILLPRSFKDATRCPRHTPVRRKQHFRRTAIIRKPALRPFAAGNVFYPFTDQPPGRLLRHAPSIGPAHPITRASRRNAPRIPASA